MTNTTMEDLKLTMIRTKETVFHYKKGERRKSSEKCEEKWFVDKKVLVELLKVLPRL